MGARFLIPLARNLLRAPVLSRYISLSLVALLPCLSRRGSLFFSRRIVRACACCPALFLGSNSNRTSTSRKSALCATTSSRPGPTIAEYASGEIFCLLSLSFSLSLSLSLSVTARYIALPKSIATCWLACRLSACSPSCIYCLLGARSLCVVFLSRVYTCYIISFPFDMYFKRESLCYLPPPTVL